MHKAQGRSRQRIPKDVMEVTIKSAVVIEGQSELPLPHEHDETHHSQSGGPHAIMRQARLDIKRGIVDTDRRGAYGLGEGEGLQEELPQQQAEQRKEAKKQPH